MRPQQPGLQPSAAEPEISVADSTAIAVSHPEPSLTRTTLLRKYAT